MTRGIQDNVVVITGASSGLGKAIARHLGGHGKHRRDARLHEAR